MHVIRFSWLISIAISFFGLLIVGQLFSVQPKDATGNLGFIGTIFLFPFILLSLFTTFRYFTVLSRSIPQVGIKIAGILGGLLLIAFFLYFSIDTKNAILAEINEPISPFDEKGSQIYFNFYTFGLIHTVSGVLGALFGLLKARVEKVEEENLDIPEDK